MPVHCWRGRRQQVASFPAVAGQWRSCGYLTEWCQSAIRAGLDDGYQFPAPVADGRPSVIQRGGLQQQVMPARTSCLRCFDSGQLPGGCSRPSGGRSVELLLVVDSSAVWSILSSESAGFIASGASCWHDDCPCCRKMHTNMERIGAHPMWGSWQWWWWGHPALVRGVAGSVVSWLSVFLGKQRKVSDGKASPIGMVQLFGEPVWIACRRPGGFWAISDKLLMMWQSYASIHFVISNCFVGMLWVSMVLVIMIFMW